VGFTRTEITEIRSAVSGDVVAQATGGGLDMREVLAYAREVGGKDLRRMAFHQRADLLKELVEFLTERKNQLYTLSFQTGATRADSMMDIDGGIGNPVRPRFAGEANDRFASGAAIRVDQGMRTSVFTTSRAQVMNDSTAGLSVRFLKSTISAEIRGPSDFNGRTFKAA
jgi:acyl-CoA reductase-like NAD-dependent aldehyde dehydrogenase